MSTAARAAVSRPLGQPTSPRPAPRRRASLRELPPPRPTVARRGVFSVMVLALLLGGMVMLLALNTSLASGAFEVNGLTRGQHALALQEQYLVQEVALAESPEALQARAELLGMVPASAPVFLRIADGAILGIPTPSKALAPSTSQRATVASADGATLDGPGSTTGSRP